MLKYFIKFYAQNIHHKKGEKKKRKSQLHGLGFSKLVNIYNIPKETKLRAEMGSLRKKKEIKYVLD